MKRITLLVGLLVLTAGCGGPATLGTGEPEVGYTADGFVEERYTDGGYTIVSGYDGRVGNHGNATAEGVTVTMKLVMADGSVYTDTTYVGDIPPGETRDWETTILFKNPDGDEEIRGDSVIVEGDNFDDVR